MTFFLCVCVCFFLVEYLLGCFLVICYGLAVVDCAAANEKCKIGLPSLCFFLRPFLCSLTLSHTHTLSLFPFFNSFFLLFSKKKEHSHVQSLFLAHSSTFFRIFFAHRLLLLLLLFKSETTFYVKTNKCEWWRAVACSDVLTEWIQMSTLGKYKEISRQKLISQDTTYRPRSSILSTILFISFLYRFPSLSLVCLFVCMNECTYSFYYSRQWIFTPNTHSRAHAPEKGKGTAFCSVAHFGFAHIIILYNLTNKVLFLFVTNTIVLIPYIFRSGSRDTFSRFEQVVLFLNLIRLPCRCAYYVCLLQPHERIIGLFPDQISKDQRHLNLSYHFAHFKRFKVMWLNIWSLFAAVCCRYCCC